MKWPKTRWSQVTYIAFAFAIVYFVAVVGTQIHWRGNWGWEWPNWLRDTANAALAVALMIISIWYGGILTDFYDKLTGFGITEVRQDRHGADPTLNKLWIDRISGSDEVTIVGTLSQGWFVIAIPNLEDLFNRSKKPKKFRVCLLDPFGKVWRSKIELGQSSHEQFLRDATQVFRNLCKLIVDYPDRIVVQLYDTEAISCVIARGAIYLGLYLPRTERKEIPEFSISGGSFLGDKVSESVNKLKNSAPEINPDGLNKYIKTMEKHFITSREAFWGDPEVFCDFCKEHYGLPSEFSRRYPSFGKTRIVSGSEDFFLVPSLGQMMEDHTLIVTKAHVTSSAQLDAKALEELTTILSKFQVDAGKNGKCHLCFEHGVPFESTIHGGCGICHCHIHSLPVQQPDYNPISNLEQFLKKKGCKFSKHDLASWSEVHKFSENSYLCVQSGSLPPIAFVFDIGQQIQSQLMREFIAENCPSARTDWDWRSAKDEPATLQSTCDHLNKILIEAAVPSTRQ